LTSIEIPNSVTSIDYGAFWGCRGLTSIEIPNSVTSIGDCGFLECSGLTEINVDSGNKNYKSIDGILFNYDETLLQAYPEGKTNKSYTIPNSVTSIAERAFNGCRGLTSVKIPNSVTSIGVCAFWGCSGLTSIEIPNSVTSIGRYAFEWCSGLTSVEIPNSVTSIGNWTFENCNGLTSVTIPHSVISIDSSAFNGCNSLTDVCYSGSEEEWEKINIGSNNEPLTNATIHYNSAPDCQMEIVDYSELDGKTVINSSVINNTNTAVSCTMYTAVYSADGTLKACDSVNADIAAGNATDVDITVSCVLESGDTAKTFMWKDNMTPLANTAELTIE
jgi:hypothetical protein